MNPSEILNCPHLSCSDVRTDLHVVPGVEIDSAKVHLIMISEASPPEMANYYYAPGDPLFASTTIQAFNDAGLAVTSVAELLQRGIYLTTAVKCGKTGYGIATNSIKLCSEILGNELALFPNVKVLMLMGDVAIRALNYIAARVGEKRIIPAGSTYKIRDAQYYYKGIRVFPSYLQAGPSFFIEKSKRRMIAEDLRTALGLLDSIS